MLDPRAYRQAIGARRVPVFNSDEGRAARATAQRRLASAMDADAPEPSGRPRRRLMPAGPEPEFTVGTPLTDREPLPGTLVDWALHRRRAPVWRDSVERLFPYVGEVRRLYAALQAQGEAPIPPPGEERPVPREVALCRLLEGGFQIPTTIRTDRVMVRSEEEADYVVAMDRWLTTRRDETVRMALPPVNQPDMWRYPDITDLTVEQGQTESPSYRSLRLEALLILTTGRFMSFDDFDLVRRDRRVAHRFRLENITSPEAVGRLLTMPLRNFAVLPESIQAAMPAAGMAVPRLRAMYFFGDVMRDPGAYGLTEEDAVLYEENLRDAAEFEWAHCLAIALEADYRATGRVVVQQPAVPAFIRRHLVDRQVPAIMLGNLPGGGPPSAIDVPALLARVEGAVGLAQEYLYFRVDNAANSTMRWSYFFEGRFAEAGSRTSRFGGRPVNPWQEPTRGSSATPRPRRGEPGYREVGTETVSYTHLTLPTTPYV